MSMHKSLKINAISKPRTVRKRRERLEVIYARLLKNGGLTEEQIKVYGLPKEKIIKLRKIKKVEKKETTDLGTPGVTKT